MMALRLVRVNDSGRVTSLAHAGRAGGTSAGRPRWRRIRRTAPARSMSATRLSFVLRVACGQDISRSIDFYRKGSSSPDVAVPLIFVCHAKGDHGQDYRIDDIAQHSRLGDGRCYEPNVFVRPVAP
jgi:hypothetical protein